MMPLGAPHTHYVKNVSKSDSQIKLSIFCTPHNKAYVISGNVERDSIYISSSKMKTKQNYCNTKDFFGQTARIYSLRIGDCNFHHGLLNDTIEVKIVKPNLTSENYKFLVLTDYHIKS